jgi:hypothetical protein
VSGAAVFCCCPGGWPDSVPPLLAFLQLGAVVLFLIPRTEVLGAVLLAGYLNGIPESPKYEMGRHIPHAG